MRRLLVLLSLLLSLPSIARGQGGNTTVTAIIRDPNGALYTNSQVNITFFDPGTPGKLPLLNGSTFQTTYTIFATDSFGRFTQSIADNGIIDSGSGTVNTQWSFRVIYSDRLTSFVYRTPINCALNIPATCTAGVMDISAQLQAVAALLPAQPGGGGSFVVRGPPCASTMNFQMAGTFPTTANTAFNVSLNCNVTSTSITQAGGGSVQVGAIAQFTLTQDAIGGRSFNWPANFIDQPSIQVAALSTTNASFWYDGTNWHAQTFPAAGGGGGNSAGVSGDVQKSTGTGAFAVAGINDNGTTIKVAEDTQFKGPNPSFDVTRYGVRYITSPGSTTATCTNSSTAVTLAAAVDFINGDGIVLQKCGPATSLSTPIAPSSVNQRAVANGVTTRSYKVVAEDFSLGLTAASPATNSAVTAAILGAINTATISSAATTNGITTYTTTSNHNLAVGAQILIGTNGVLGQVLSTPTGSTFTLRIPGTADQASIAASGSVNVASHVQVYWTGQANVMRYWVYRQDGGAGNFNLVGVAQGSEPFYDDYGWVAPNAPAYVPTTAPIAPINQSVATTIVSGGGTTSLVVANAPSNSTSGVQALHDDTVAVQAAYAAATAATGGRVYIPKAATNIPTVTFNFPMKFSGGGPVPTEIELAGSITANQPIVPASWMTFTGVADSTGFSPAFAKNYYAMVSGAAYPLFLVQGTKASIRFDHLYVYGFNEQQWSVLSDATFGGGGATDIYIQNSDITVNKASGIPYVTRGVGFNYNVKDNVFGNQSAVFYSQGGLRLMGSAVSVPTGIPGIGVAENNTFLSVGVKADTEALNGASITNVGSPWAFRNLFAESLFQSFIDMRNITSNNWFNWSFEGLFGADAVNLAPGLDTTGSSGLDALTIKGGGGGSFNAVGTKGLYYTAGGLNESVSLPVGYAALAYNTVNIGSSINNFRMYETDGGLRLKPGGVAFVELVPPANLTGAVAAGGAVPLGTWTYRITAVGWNGGESAPGNATLPLAVTGGNQTVNLTWTASGIGTMGYYVYRSNGGGYARVFSTPVTTTSASDNVASPSGTSISTASGTGSSYMNSTEVASPIFRLPSASGALFKVDMSAGTLTANRSITWADASGTPALGAPFTTNGILFGNGTSLIQATAASGVGTFCLTETNGGVPVFGSCAGSAATAWSSLTNPSVDLALNMSTFNSIFTSGVMTGTRHAWEFVDGNSTSTGSLFNLHTGATSTMKPFTATAQGTANGVQMSTAGILAPTGTGGITANAWTPSLTANQLLVGNAGSISSLIGTLTGTNPVLTLTSALTASVPFALNTPASPTADIFDISINTVKTSWVDNLGIWHAPSYTATGSGALVLTGTEGTCPSPAGGVDILCIGNLGTHTIQSSLNGAAFKDNAQFSNSGPAAHGVCLVGAIFPQLNCTTAGTSGQAFVSGGGGADGAFGTLGVVGGGTGNVTNTLHGVGIGEGTAPLNFSSAGTTGQAFISGGAGADGSYGTFDLSLGTNTVNNLPINRGGTGSATLAAANIVTVTGAITPNNCVKWSSATVVTDSGGTCGGAGGSARLDQILGGTAPNIINSTIFPQTWNWALTGSTTAFKFGENTAATGTNNILLQASTLNTSTAIPFQADNNGNGVNMSSVGFFTSKGTGGVDSNMLFCDVTTTTKCIKNVLSGISAATTRNKTWTDTVGTVAEDANTIPFTNKSADAEGTGNVFTRPLYISFSPACNNTTAGPGSFNVPTSGATTFSCTGTTTTQGNADFVDGSTTTLTTEGLRLPDGWVGNIDISVVWWANAASANAVRWSVATGCVADSTAINTGPSYNAASATNSAYTGTANQRKTTTQTTVAVTNCAAGSSIYFQVQRIGADGGDTLAATAELIELQVKGRATK